VGKREGEEQERGLLAKSLLPTLLHK
jgi:hypothetical protein